MNTMEITKIVGALCGSLLVFLLIQTASHALFDTESDEVAFSVEIEEPEAAVAEGGEAEGGEAAPAEEVDVASLVAAADPAAGERVFRKCQACHKVDGNNAVGPHLDGVVGRTIASVDGFNYSGALPEGDWTEEHLYQFLAAPKDWAPGTSMSFAGLDKSEDRADVIAYLASVGG